MQYFQYLPCRELRQFIACYWTIDFSGCEVVSKKELVLPDGSIDLIFNVGEESLQNHLYNGYKSTIADFALVGQRKGYMELEKGNCTRILGVRFKPFGLVSIFKGDISQLTGTVVDDREFRSALVDRILVLLSKKGISEALIPEIDRIIKRHINTERPVNPYVKMAAEKIVASDGQFRVGKFCADYGIHKSTLEKTFLVQVGITPKELASIVRFNQVYSRLCKSKGNHAQIALDCGYYDQSHMIREFKKLTGRSPKALWNSGYVVPQIVPAFHEARRKYCGIA